MEWFLLAVLSAAMFYASAWLFNRVTTGEETITRACIAVSFVFSMAVAPLAFIVAASALASSLLFCIYKYVDRTTNMKDWFNKDI